MSGYLNNAVATAEAFTNGWLHTGDLAYLDEGGFLFFVDRKKELIIRGGYNVYLREVEEVLYTNPKISEAAVVGIPDARLGEEIKAYVTLKKGASGAAGGVRRLRQRATRGIQVPTGRRDHRRDAQEPDGKNSRRRSSPTAASRRRGLPLTRTIAREDVRPSPKVSLPRKAPGMTQSTGMTLRESLATQPMRPFQIRVVAICIILAFVDGFEVLVGAFTATSLAKDFNLDAVQIGYFLSASTFGMAVGAVFISPFADRIGRRKHIIMCLALIVVGMIGSAIAMNYVFLLVARAFAGLWIGALIPSLNILVSEYSSDAKRGTAMGIYGIGLPAGSAAGGFITTFLIAAWSWRAAFWFGAILTGLLLLGSLVWLPESIHYLVEKRPPGALQEYNKIGTKLGYPQEDTLPPSHLAGKKGNVVVSAIFKGIMGKRTAYLWLGYGLLTAAFYFGNQWTPRLVTQYLSDKYKKSDLGTLGWSSYVDTPKSAIEALAKSEPTKGWDPNIAYVQQMTDSAAQALGNNAGVLVSLGGVIAALLFAWPSTKCTRAWSPS